MPIDVAKTNTPTDGSYTQLLVASWIYYYNFLKKDPRTQKTPAEVHLGSLRARNIKAMFNNIKKHSKWTKTHLWETYKHCWN